MHHNNSPLVTTGDTDEATSDGASSIIQTLYLVQVIYLVFAGIIALLFAIFNIVAFAVLVVAFSGYFGLFWYNIASSGRTRENASALAIRSFSVAAVLGVSSLSFNNLPYPSHYFLIFPELIIVIMMEQLLPNILLLLVVSYFDWRWNGLIS